MTELHPDAGCITDDEDPGTATAVLLPVGGATFIVPNPLLTAALYASLPTLLVWIAHSATKVSRAADSR